MRKLLLSLFLLTSITLIAQEYSVNLIPPELMEGVDAVVRVDQGHFKILSIDKAEYNVKYAVTILNQRASDEAEIFLLYDKLTSLSEIDIKVYDAAGNKIRRVKSSEINDRSAYSDNLFDDSRRKYIDVSQSSYPYTVEYSYKKKYKYLYSIPSWYFQNSSNSSVVSSSFRIDYPVSVGARYRAFNFEGEKTESSSEGVKSITWEMNSIPAMGVEKYAPSFKETVPYIELGVSRFSFEGYEGNMSTWDGIAAWQRSLNKGRNSLSQNQIKEIRELTDGLSRFEKIQAVYEYVQQNTRYVSIQLGVGGFQPFPASTVEENGYGDCKALSFYTQCLLTAIGIESFYSWVYGGREPPAIDRDFPVDNFNHIILAVPHENDTIWLECTSQTNPLGYLGAFTGDREALLINEDGGHIVKTTSYPTASNIKKMEVEVSVDKDGHALVRSTTDYEGIMADRMLTRATWSHDDQKEYIEESIRIPTFQINDFAIKREGTTAQREMDIWVNKLLSKSGNRLFLQPNVMNKNYFVPLKNNERKTDIVVQHGYHEYDTVNFELPSGFRIEATFDPVVIDSEFGSYRAEVIANEDGKFKYVRHYMQRKGRFDASTYREYQGFHRKVVRADKRKIALISGT